MKRSTRRQLLVVLLLSTLACRPEEAKDGPPPSPAIVPPAALRDNVVLITLDTTRADALGAYGQPLPTTPHLDRMAEAGVLFEQAVTSSPSTLPSHASILTGKQPYSHGARSNSGFVLAAENTTLAEVLQRHGYVTGAEVAAPVIAARTKLDQGFDHFRGPDSEGAVLEVTQIRSGEGLVPTKRKDRAGADITKRGIEFLRKHRDRPFFLWLHYFDPHVPYAPPEEFRARIPDSLYHAEVARVDFEVERVRAELEALGLAGRTLIVVTADHGEGLLEHGEHTHMFYVFESTMRVPLIFTGPTALASGRRVTSMARSIDIAPTILDWLKLPELDGAQGRSLAPMLRGESELGAAPGYGESIEFVTAFDGSVLRFLREDRWKYIHKPRPSLYDLAADPGELKDLAAAEPERVEAMRARLATLLGEAGEAPDDATTPVDEATQDELVALGYVGAQAPVVLDGPLDGLETRGRDPDDMIEDVAIFAGAHAIPGQADTDKLVDMFSALQARNPESRSVLLRLVRSLERADRNERAVELIARATEIAPADGKLLVTLAGMAEKAGRDDDAISAMRQAIDLEPCAPARRGALGEMLRKRGREGERYAIAKEGVDRCPQSAEFQNDLAWLLATSREESLREGAEAVELAERAVAASSPPNPGFLDTLAASHAEAGNFAEAIRIESEAIELLERLSAPAQAIAIFRAHLVQFEAQLPIRD